MVVAEASSKIASFVFVVIVARELGTRGYGYIAFALAFFPLLLMFGRAGLDATTVRDIARDRSRMSVVFASGLRIRTGLAVVALLAGCLLAPLFVPSGRILAAVIVTGAALFLDEISTFLGTIFKAYERMWWHALVTLVNRIVSTALAFIVLSATDDLVLVAVAYALGSLGALVFGWIVLLRKFPPIDLRAADRRIATGLLAQGAPLGFAALLSMAAFRVDMVLLQALRGPVAVGLYGVAYRFLESLLFVAWNLANVALPRLARSDSKATWSRTFEATLSLIFLFYLPIAVGSMFLSRWVVVAVFSDRFAGAAAAVPWLTWSALLYGIAHLSRMSTVARGSSRGIVYVALGALSINVVGNLIFIPTHGFIAAAVVTFVTECFEAVALGGMFVRRYGWPRPSGVVLVAPVAAAGMTIALAATGDHEAIGFGVGVVTYLVLAVVAARLLAAEEFRQLTSLLRKRGAVEAGTQIP